MEQAATRDYASSKSALQTVVSSWGFPPWLLLRGPLTCGESHKQANYNYIEFGLPPFLSFFWGGGVVCELF